MVKVASNLFNLTCLPEAKPKLNLKSRDLSFHLEYILAIKGGSYLKGGAIWEPEPPFDSNLDRKQNRSPLSCREDGRDIRLILSL